MEIRQFAEAVLFGTSLEEKLLVPGRLVDGCPGEGLVLPPAPGRPPGLGFSGGDGVRFGDVRRLHSEKDRGLILHFFANHELLALELMALALLKFPQAPGKFRRGLVQTLKDEQAHVALYLERMGQIGVGFGDIPLSDFFWRAIAPLETPLEFVAYLSLTLEQANLDYATYYAQVYQQLDDKPTAQILQRIYRDEIGHVKHGLVWFNRWRDRTQSEWDSFKQVLQPPLTPNRAKGIGFNRAGRLKAGLSANFIDELEIFARSKGRCPALYYFNPACELYIAPRPQTPSSLVQHLAADFAALPVLLCARDDAVLVPQRPSAAFLSRLQGLNFVLPEFVEYDQKLGVAATELAGRKLSALRPWGRSPDSGRLLAPLEANLAAATKALCGPLWQEGFGPLYSKQWSAEVLDAFLAERPQDAAWLCPAETVGRFCSSIEAVEERGAHLAAAGFGALVGKAPYGAAGQNQYRFSAGALNARIRGLLEGLIARQGGVLVEPWLDKVCDLSIQLEIEAVGQGRVLGWSRFFTDNKGQYRGGFVTQQVAGLSVATRRFLYGDNAERGLVYWGRELAAAVAAAAAPSGYVGPLGIDAFIFRHRGQLRLKPIVEINPRYTMGRVGLQLRRRVNSARTALWLLLGRRQVEAAGFSSIAAFAEQMEARFPPTLFKGQLGGGVLFTTDPTQAQAFASVLLVGRTLEECTAYFAELDPGLARWTEWVRE